MRGPARSPRSGLMAACVVGAVAVVAAILAPGAVGTACEPAGRPPGHRCLVMTGSGDPAFTRSFNPYSGSVLNGGFVKGAIYEPLVVATVAGGGTTYPWLAKSWKWSNGDKMLTLKIQPGVKWSDGQPLTAADVVYSLTAGKQDKAMDIIGMFHRARTSCRSSRWARTQSRST